MQCMKCGRDVEAGEVFCGACQEVMAKYPVKPGTVVQLPSRPREVPGKKPVQRHKANLPLEEQVSLLRRLCRSLAISLVVLVLMTLGLGALSLQLYAENWNKHAVGQNYSAISTEPPTTVPTETNGETAPADVAG